MTRPIREAARVGAIGVTVIALSSLAMAQQPAKRPSSTAPGVKNDKAWAPPRTAWGDPDLQGTYTNKNESGIPFERSNQFEGKALADVDDVELAELIRERQRQISERAPLAGGETGAGPVHWYENYEAKNSRAWLVVDPPDGRIPPQTAEATQRAASLAAARGARGPADAAEYRSLYDRCITRGLPGSMMPAIYGNSYQIVQAPGYVAIRYEMVHETRLIPLDGRPHAGSNIRFYMGDARGHWEGKTLVVETTNFTDRTNYRGASKQLRMVERFTPVTPTLVEWSVTFDDDHTWARPWTFAMNLTKDDTQQVFEYACHEGNYGLSNILSAARSEEKSVTRDTTK
jgi:hypothetical protein